MIWRAQAILTLSAAAALLALASPGSAHAQTTPTFEFDDAIISAIDGVGAPLDVAIADFNFDGAPDAVVAVPAGGGGAGEVVLLLGEPARPGSFAIEQRINLGALPLGVTIADFNGDQQLDIAVALSVADENNVLVFVGGGELVFDSALSVAGLATALAAADLNRDSMPDLAVASESAQDGAGLLTIFVNQGDGVLSLGAGAPNGAGEAGSTRFASGASESLLLGKKPKSVCPADVDGDGDDDLIALSAGDGQSGGEVAVFGNVGTAGLRAAVPVFEPFANIAVGVNALAEAVADLDRDGRPDIVVANFGGFDAAGEQIPGEVLVLRNVSTGADRIAFNQPVLILDEVQARSVAAADLDHDGDPDLPIIVGTIPNPTPVVAVLENRSGVGEFAFAAPQALPSEATPAIVRTANVEGDADDDVIAFGADSLSQPTAALVAAHRNRTPLPEDIDESGGIGPDDLLRLLAAWGKSCALAPCPEDIDGNGSVGPGDLLRLLAAWGQRTF